MILNVKAVRLETNGVVKYRATTNYNNRSFQETINLSDFPSWYYIDTNNAHRRYVAKKLYRRVTGVDIDSILVVIDNSETMSLVSYEEVMRAKDDAFTVVRNFVEITGTYWSRDVGLGFHNKKILPV